MPAVPFVTEMAPIDYRFGLKEAFSQLGWIVTVLQTATIRDI